jgi:methionine-rich copper-binding protein CopC
MRAFIVGAALLLAALPAFAHARLTGSAPADKASVKTPGLIKLTFSEALEPAFSGASLADAKGANIPVSKSVGGATITLLPPRLRRGLYTVTWHSVGHDTHRLTGKLVFTVIP